MSLSDTDFGYMDRAVAFIDVLGFADLVKQSQESSRALDHVKRLVATNKLFEKFTHQFLKSFAEAAFFSDSFVLSVDSPEHRFIHLIRETGYLCRYLLLQGLACRGAITTGPLHHRERVVVGPALVDAYRLEQSVPIYPRVILDGAAMEHWNQEFRLIEGHGPAHSSVEAVVKRDRDGQYFLDIFNAEWLNFLPWTDFVPSDNPIPTDHIEFLKKAGKQLDDRRYEHRANLKISAKYEWLAAEFNDSARHAGAPTLHRQQ